MKNFKRASLSVAIATLMVQPLLAGATPTLIENIDFADGKILPWQVPAWWSGGAGTVSADDGRFCMTTTEASDADWSAQFRYSELTFIEGETYTLSFDAWASDPTIAWKFVAVDEANALTMFEEYGFTASAAIEEAVGTAFEMEYVSEASSTTAQFQFLLGSQVVPVGETICLDNISIQPPGLNLLHNGDFADDTIWEIGLNWGGATDTGAGTSEIDADGRMCIAITTESVADYGAQLKQAGLVLAEDGGYSIEFDVWSSVDMTIPAQVMDSESYAPLVGQDVDVTARLDEAAQHVVIESVTNDASGDGDSEFRFVLGAGNVPAGESICFDNIKVLDPQGYSINRPAEPEMPVVTVNQVGYFPNLTKVATYKIIEADVADTTTARAWSLLDSTDTEVAAGTTMNIGLDANSGDVIHHIDFSAYTAMGSDLKLEITELDDSKVTSFAFDIADDLLDQMQYDALSYFYHNRSGVPILASIVGDLHARDAGHVGGTVAGLDEDDMAIEIPVGDDRAVSTWSCRTDKASLVDVSIDTSLPGCRTDVDVSGGWYDAGDHGKYVVNGGVSVWTLLNQYERASLLSSNADKFADGAMNLPVEEMANGLPDLLDEAKFELDFFLKMQIPAGELQAGMVYHKMHDLGWTGIPQLPSEDTRTRFIHPATTAATLNLAATGAQCYRVYKAFDQTFADTCLDAAKAAYVAAKLEPAQYSGDPGSTEVVNSGDGGGMYPDQQVDDEFYWAANELYLATGESMYMDDILASPIHNRFIIDEQFNDVDFKEPNSTFSWGQTNMLGVLSLVTAGDAYNADFLLMHDAKQLVMTAADNYAWYANDAGYSAAMNSDELLWGSNSFAVNNMIVLGIANDISAGAESCYVDAMANTMTYLLGNNPMNFSYVSGYGENALMFPHHRVWAIAKNADLPGVPDGALSGGPNMGLEDPVSSTKIAGCASEKCYLDHIDAWAVNEITVNWNSPLAWVSSYLDDEATTITPSCSVDYSSMTAPALTAKGQNDINNGTDLESNLISALAELEAAQAALATAQVNLATTDVELLEANTALETANVTLATANADLVLAKSDLIMSQSDLASAQLALNTLQASSTATESELATAELALLNAQNAASISNSNLIIAQTELETANASIDALNAQVPVQQVALSNALTDLVTAQNALATAQSDLATASSTLETYKSQAPVQDAALANALADLAAAEARVKELEADAEADAGSVPFIFAAFLMFVAVAARRKRLMK